MEENKYPIKEEWSDYYNMLESIEDVTMIYHNVKNFN